LQSQFLLLLLAQQILNLRLRMTLNLPSTHLQFKTLTGSHEEFKSEKEQIWRNMEEYIGGENSGEQEMRLPTGESENNACMRRYFS